MLNKSPYKIPISILVVIFNTKHEILLLKRVNSFNFWQSVTGSIDFEDEELDIAAKREILEETGIVLNDNKVINTCIESLKLNELSLYTLYNLNYSTEYEIFPQFRYRYEEDIHINQEHWFMLKVEENYPININAQEHTKYQWLTWQEAIKQCFSPSNAIAIQNIFNSLLLI